MGVVFRGDPDIRVCPVAVNRKGGAVSNGLWAVQARGTLMAKKLQASRGADEWRVYLSKSGLAAPVTEGRWVFTEAAGAFAAVHVVRGEFTFLKESTDRFCRWLQCADATSPVIIEVATTSDWPDLAAFRRALLDRTPTLDGEVLSYSGLQGDRLTLFLAASAQDVRPFITRSYARRRPQDLPACRPRPAAVPWREAASAG
jgi:hypothetical protein